jgi:DNA-binding transcriptional LysR family regulator
MDEIRQLRIFAAIAESGNLSAVARQLDSSTSLVSRCLAKLERRFGVRLATRTTRSLELTEEGRTYYERVQDILLALRMRRRRLRETPASRSVCCVSACRRKLAENGLLRSLPALANSIPESMFDSYYQRDLTSSGTVLTSRFALVSRPTSESSLESYCRAHT